MLNSKFKILNTESGFTLAEVVVSVAIFAVVLTGILVLLDYTLKINRRTEALRQSSQAVRNLVDFLAKEIRDGRVDYSVDNGESYNANACPTRGAVFDTTPTSGGLFPSTGPRLNSFGKATGSAGQSDVMLPLINLKDERECFFLANTNGAPIVAGTQLYFSKRLRNGTRLPDERLNPTNMAIDYLRFYIRPLCDPYSSSCTGGLPKTMPTVTIVMRARLTLNTGEQVIIPYQTTISTDDYSIPSN